MAGAQRESERPPLAVDDGVWILVVRPPRERPIACAWAPLFCAGRRAVRLGRGAVDQVNAAWLGNRERLQQALPEPTPGPAVEAVLDRGRRPVHGRTILPTPARAQDMNDPAQDATIIDPPCARLISWQQRLDDRPLSIGEPELTRHHSSSTVFKLESRGELCITLGSVIR